MQFSMCKVEHYTLYMRHDDIGYTTRIDPEQFHDLNIFAPLILFCFYTYEINIVKRNTT